MVLAKKIYRKIGMTLDLNSYKKTHHANEARAKWAANRPYLEIMVKREKKAAHRHTKKNCECFWCLCQSQIIRTQWTSELNHFYRVYSITVCSTHSLVVRFENIETEKQKKALIPYMIHNLFKAKQKNRVTIAINNRQHLQKSTLFDGGSVKKSL